VSAVGESLTAERLDVDPDVTAFTKLATDAGWGDGLPLVPPTEEKVQAFVAASRRYPEHVLGEIPPRGAACTVELLAINAVMAGAPAESMPLLVAAIEAMTAPEYGLFSQNATTNSVVPGLLVNGPIRHDLEIPFGAGCFGGQAGPAPAIGRATRLVMRNVGDQVVGVTSKSVFGQPARVVSFVVGEWEERSPWTPLAERRGVPGNAVTVFGGTGTIDIADIHADSGPELLEIIGKSLAFPGTNAFIHRSVSGSGGDEDILVCLPPPWVDLITADIPDLEDVQHLLWMHAALPVSWWPATHREKLEAHDVIDDRGYVKLLSTLEQYLVMVCGGLGNLHALALHTFGQGHSVTRPIGDIPPPPNGSAS